jgi:hypothetical protein
MAAPSLTPGVDFLPEVYQAICKVQKELSRDGIAKNRKNQQQGYNFRGIDDVYNSISALLAGADLCILPRMAERTQEERVTQKGGTLFYVTVRADFDFVSAKDGSKHTVTMYGEAMDSADKATNKAMSAAYKYACMQVFCIPTEGMEDADGTTPTPAPKPALVKPQPAVARIEELPDYEYEEVLEEGPSEVAEQLKESLSIAGAFAQLKVRYEAIGSIKTYYAVLGLYGKQHANFTDIREAKDCYKDMLADIRKREAGRQ